MLPTFFHIQWEKAQQLIINHLGNSGPTFQAPVNYIINFISENFGNVLPYRVLNSLRSAISAYYARINDFVFYWQVFLIKDLHNLDIFYMG